MAPPALPEDQFSASRFDHSTRSRVYGAELAIEAINDNVIDISSNLNTLDTRVDKNRLFYVTVEASFEKDQNGAWALNYGSDNKVDGAFGIPLLRNCKLNGYRAISNLVSDYSNLGILDTPKNIQLGIQFYNEYGNLDTSTKNTGLVVKMKKTVGVVPATPTINPTTKAKHEWRGFRSKIGSGSDISRGSRLSLSKPKLINENGTVNDSPTVNDIQIQDDTQFRIVFEFLSMEDDFLGYNLPTLMTWVKSGKNGEQYIQNGSTRIDFQGNDVDVKIKYQCDVGIYVDIVSEDENPNNGAVTFTGNSGEVTFTGDNHTKPAYFTIAAIDRTIPLTVTSFMIDGVEQVISDLDTVWKITYTDPDST
jgi:hypothetical protein